VLLVCGWGWMVCVVGVGVWLSVGGGGWGVLGLVCVEWGVLGGRVGGGLGWGGVGGGCGLGLWWCGGLFCFGWFIDIYKCSR